MQGNWQQDLTISPSIMDQMQSRCQMGLTTLSSASSSQRMATFNKKAPTPRLRWEEHTLLACHDERCISVLCFSIFWHKISQVAALHAKEIIVLTRQSLSFNMHVSLA